MLETGHLAPYSRLFFFLCLLTSSSFSQEYPEKGVNQLLKTGIENILLQNYHQAKIDFQLLNSKYPDLPLGKIYLAATEIARTSDYGEEFDDELIMQYLEGAEDQSKKLLESKPHNTWYYYFLGLSQGYISYYSAFNGSWLKSLNEAFNSVSNLETCIKKDPKFYEAYSGIGAYKYWKSKKTEFLSWLPFIDDEKETGISLLENAVNKSSYNFYLAVNSLVWIYIDQKKFNEALNVSEKVLKKYPNNRFFKWGSARAYEDVNPEKAIRQYYEILESYPALDSLNRYNEIVLKHLIAQQYSKLGQKKKALSLCNEILGIKSLKQTVVEKLGDRIQRVRDLKSKL